MNENNPWKRGMICITAALLLVPLLNGCTPVDTSYKDPWHEKIAAAGIVEKNVEIGQVSLNYAEGPGNGPALLLLHAQHMDWYSYSRVLTELSKSFHVFAVSYHGHGKTKSPAEYMTAASIGADLAAFIETAIKEPVFVTGNSSGGLLTAWLAANRPELVKAILLEDPPLFSAEYPRSRTTIAYKTFSTCHDYLSGNNTDFLIYWLNSNRAFIEKNTGKYSFGLLLSSIQEYRAANPGQPIELNFLPDIIRLFIRGLDYYDPHFGNAFYDGSWNAGFDHADALKRIRCPVLLLHANFRILENGTLDGAMDQEDSDLAVSLLSNVTYVRINAAHTVHIDKPDEFTKITRSFFLEQ
jgi:pimeloyl-ACP methyl ester carboxylesterase